MARVLIATRISQGAKKEDDASKPEDTSDAAKWEASRIERDKDNAVAWAEANGHQVVAVSEDRNVSGGKSPFKRPQLGQWLNDPAKRSQYDVIVCSKLDRLARNAIDLAQLRQWADDNGKQLVCIEQNLNWPAANAADGFMWNILAAVAEMELALTKERYAAVRADIVAGGGMVGKLPWGFVATGEKYRKTISVDPACRAYLVEMVERALRGESFVTIARWLDASGVPTSQDRGEWSPVSVRQILNNECLKGEYRNGGKLQTFAGIISAGMWSKLQTVIAKPARGAANTGDVMLSADFLRCGQCGGKMYRTFSGTGTNRVGAYRCNGGGSKAGSKCKNMVRQDMAEEFVSALIVEKFGHLPVMEVTEQVGNDYGDQIAALRAEAASLDWDAPDYDQRHAALRAEMVRLQGLPVSASVFVRTATGETVGEMWAQLDTEGRRGYLVATGATVSIRRTDSITKTEEGWTDWLLGALPNGRHCVLVEGDVSVMAGAVTEVAA